MSVSPTLSERVSPWTVLMAFRYGLGRLTGAHDDALELLRRHWPVLEQFRGSIVSDLEFTERTTEYDDIRRSTQDVLAWIEMLDIVRHKEAAGDPAVARAH